MHTEMYRKILIIFIVIVSNTARSVFDRSSKSDTPNVILPSEDVKQVSKFPPVIEHFVQLIQKYFSNYVYEDLSRPPTWDSPNFGMEHSQFNKDKINGQNLTKNSIYNRLITSIKH